MKNSFARMLKKKSYSSNQKKIRNSDQKSREISVVPVVNMQK